MQDKLLNHCFYRLRFKIVDFADGLERSVVDWHCGRNKVSSPAFSRQWLLRITFDLNVIVNNMLRVHACERNKAPKSAGRLNGFPTTKFYSTISASTGSHGL